MSLVNWLFGTRYSDLCYGYNAFWARHLSAWNLDCDGLESERVMNIRAAEAGLCIQEIPSHEHARVHGEGNLRIIRDGWRMAKVIVRERFTGDRRRGLERVTISAPEIPELLVATHVVSSGQMPRSAGVRLLRQSHPRLRFDGRPVQGRSLFPARWRSCAISLYKSHPRLTER